MTRRRCGLRAAGAVLALAALAGCSSSDAGSTTTTTTAGAASSAPSSRTVSPEATTVAAGDPTVPLLQGNPGDLGTAPTLTAGTGTPPAGLVVSDVVEGTGELATASATVDVRYVGALYSDGSVFDSSWRRGTDPISFPLNRVVPGFAGGIEGMKVGGRREIVIPPELGYGQRAQPGLPAGSTLVFVVDLVGVR
ncbi:FKBP-type peptidyl-prolyl cis-trans isomerase [Rhodococcus aerolatus]